MELHGTDFADLSSFLCLKWILGGDWKVTSSFHPLPISLAREGNKMKTCNLKVLKVTFSSAASEVAAKIREIKLTQIQLKVSVHCSSWC